MTRTTILCKNKNFKNSATTRPIISMKMVAVILVLFFVMCWTYSARADSQDENWLWPVPGVYSTWRQYGAPGNHEAIDIGAAHKTVVATKSGTVVTVYGGCKNNSHKYSCLEICSPTINGKSATATSICNSGFGNGVIIKHTDGTWSSYAHMSKVDVAPGATVKQGQSLGLTGDAGNAYDEHLHFQIRTGGSTYWSASVINNCTEKIIYDGKEIQVKCTHNSGCCKGKDHNKIVYYSGEIETTLTQPKSCDTNKQTNLYTGRTTDSTSMYVPSGYGLILLAKSKDGKWYKTSSGYYALASDVTNLKNYTMIGEVKEKVEYKIKLTTLYDLTMRAEPYADAYPVRSYKKGTTLQVIAVIKNKYDNYWYELEDHSFINAKFLSSPVGPVAQPKITETVAISKPDSNYTTQGKTSLGIKQSGTIKSNIQLSKIVAGWRSADGKIIDSATQTINGYEYVIGTRSSSGSVTGYIPSNLNSKNLIDSGTGTYYYFIDLYYPVFIGTTTDKDSPIKEMCFRYLDYKFTLNGGGTTTISTPPPVVWIGTKYVTSVTLNKTTLTLKAGETYTVTASVEPADATDPSVSWFSNNTSVATVSNGKITAKAPGTATIVAQANDAGRQAGTCTVIVTQPVTGISVTGTSSSIYAGATTTLSASVSPTNASNKNVTWSSSNTNVATVNASGVVTGIAYGDAVITAKAADGSNVTGSFKVSVRVHASSVSISGPTSLNVGSTVTLSATVSPTTADDKAVTWKSSNTNVATVDSNGCVSGIAKGTAVIRATSNCSTSVYREVTVAVIQPVESISVAPNVLTLYPKDTATLTATISPSTVNDQSVTWSTSNMSVASVSNGQVKAVAPGTAVITAKSGNGKQCVVTVTVLQPVTSIAISGPTAVLVNGSITLSANVAPSTAYNKDIVWSSSEPATASVNSNGVVKGLKAASSVQITASAQDGSGVIGTWTISVEKRNIGVSITGDNELLVGETTTLAASLSSDSGAVTTGVSWSSSNPSVAKVSSSGVVTAVANGDATITATANENTDCFASHTIHVKTLVSGISLNNDEINERETLQLTVSILPATASDQRVTWSSSNSSVAIVSANGTVTGIAEGSATITASSIDGSNVSASCMVKVYPIAHSVSVTGAHSMHPGDKATLSATVMPDAVLDKSVTWHSEDDAILTVDSNGVVTAIANGTTTVTATANSNKEVLAIHEITVTTLVSGITLSGDDTIDTGDTATITVEFLPVTASNKEVVWSSSDENLAVVDSEGHVTAINPGFVVISAEATDGSAVFGKLEIETIRKVQSISFDIDPVAYEGDYIELDTIIFPADASNQSIIFESSDESVVSIEVDEIEGCYVFAKCMKPGVARISAKAMDGSGVIGYTYITVRNLVELSNRALGYNVYYGCDATGRLGVISLSYETMIRAANANYSVSWDIEHVSGDNASKISINENNTSVNGFVFANSVDLNLSRILKTGSDVYKVVCTVNGDTAECMVSVTVKTLENELPTNVALSRTDFTGQTDEEIEIDVTPVLTPVTASLPEDVRVFINGDAIFTRFAKITADTNSFTVSFSKAGMYQADIVYSGTNYSYTCPITFSIDGESIIQPVANLYFTDAMLYLLPGETGSLSLIILPSSANDAAISWTSSDESIATVNANGVVTAVAPGFAAITATAENGVSCIGVVYVNDKLLGIDWNEDQIIEVYTNGKTQMVIQEIYTTDFTVNHMAVAPEWTLTREEGNNLTLTCQPITTVAANGKIKYGCAITLKSVSGSGMTTYRLTCSNGDTAVSTTVIVDAVDMDGTIPSMVSWANNEYSVKANELVTIRPSIICWPESSKLPTGTVMSIVGDNYWNVAVNIEDLNISRNVITASFCEPGVYTARAVYTCANMSYIVPFSVKVADDIGNVPVRLESVSLSDQDVSLEAGATHTLRTFLAPTDASNKNVFWYSENEDIATVSDNGVVTARANGTTRVFCIPDDSNCSSQYCTIVVEDWFAIESLIEADEQYLQGATGLSVADFWLSKGTIKRLTEAGLTADWSIQRISGHAAEVKLYEAEGIFSVLPVEFLEAGTDVYRVTCAAGQYSWYQDVQFTVINLSANVPERISLKKTDYTANVGEEITLDFSPVCSPAGTVMPGNIYSSYIGLGNFYSGLASGYKVNLLTSKEDKVAVAFKSPGVYVLSRYYHTSNLTYITECVITVGAGNLNLIGCTDTEPVVYIGGQSAVVSTCYLTDVSINELYGNEIVWSAEQIASTDDCATVAVLADQSGQSLYVVNTKSEGSQTWRVSCSFRGIICYKDITIHTVKPRTGLPAEVKLYQNDFNGSIGRTINVPLAVFCNPNGTVLPETSLECWSYMTDENGKEHSRWMFNNNDMQIRFNESGYYGGTLIYSSGNVNYSFKLSFAITDEESVQTIPSHLDLTLSTDSATVYPEGQTDVDVVKVVLSDSMDGYSLYSVAAYAERVGTDWSLHLLSGNACTIKLEQVSAASAQIKLIDITGTGDVQYRVSCLISGKEYYTDGTIHIASESEIRPDPEMRQTYFMTQVGTVLVIDANLYQRNSNIVLCGSSKSIWNNASAMKAMGYSFDREDDVWLPIFYESGTFETSVESWIGNLKIITPITIRAYEIKPLPESPKTLTMPKALREISEEAFYGVDVEVIDLTSGHVERIGPKAFGGCHSLLRIIIPDSVNYIAESAFAGSPNVVICCKIDTYVYKWAQQSHYPVQLIND